MSPVAIANVTSLLKGNPLDLLDQIRYEGENTGFDFKAKPTAKTADQRAAAYKGPKVVKDSKALGHKMVHKSKAQESVRTPIQ